MGLRWHSLSVVVVALGLCLLCLQPEPSSAQLTQSLGWGSAGSPGKRATANMILRACTNQDDMMEDLMMLIEREAARQRMCRAYRK